jgi:ferredoxin
MLERDRDRCMCMGTGTCACNTTDVFDLGATGGVLVIRRCTIGDEQGGNPAEARPSNALTLR